MYSCARVRGGAPEILLLTNAKKVTVSVLCWYIRLPDRKIRNFFMSACVTCPLWDRCLGRELERVPVPAAVPFLFLRGFSFWGNSRRSCFSLVLRSRLAFARDRAEAAGECGHTAWKIPLPVRLEKSSPARLT